MKKYLLLLVVTVLLGTGLRIWRLGDRPSGFTWDEAALGYNAYSLLKTGKDEYGKTLPIVLKSFGDYKPALYSYFLVPMTAIGGLNQFTTRLPSAVFGSLGIIVIFLLTSKMFGKSAGLAAAGLLTINPWAIQFSRGAWEANVNLVLLRIT
jgi:predicted membrane-bound mannosyltransferase